MTTQVLEEYINKGAELAVPKSALQEAIRSAINEKREENGLPPITDFDEAFSVEQLKTTLLSVAAIQGGFAGVNAAGRRTGRIGRRPQQENNSADSSNPQTPPPPANPTTNEPRDLPHVDELHEKNNTT